MYSSSAAAVAAVNSSNFDNAVWLCWSLLYSIFHFHIIPFGLGDASCMHSRTRIPAVTWLTLTQRTTCCRHGITHRSTASRYPAIQAAYSTTLTSQLKSSTDSSAVAPAITQHLARHCILHIAATIHNATIPGDVTAELANATTYDCVIRAGRKRSKIEIEIAILTISIKDRDRRRIFLILTIQNIGVKIDLCEGDLDLDLQHWWRCIFFVKSAMPVKRYDWMFKESGVLDASVIIVVTTI